MKKIGVLLIVLFLLTVAFSMTAYGVQVDYDYIYLVNDDSQSDPEIPSDPPLVPTLYVNKVNLEGPWDGTEQYPYISIQEAIDNAIDNDTITVMGSPTPYYENVVINKKISLTTQFDGEGYGPLIDGGGIGDAFLIESSDVLVSGWIITNSGNSTFDHGIEIAYEEPRLNNINIINCIIQNNSGGIRFNGVTNSYVENCIIRDNSGASFTIYYNSENIVIKNCQIYNNGIAPNDGCICIDGISYLGYYSAYITIRDCEIYDSSFSGIWIIRAHDINIFNNHIHDCLQYGIIVSGDSDNDNVNYNINIYGNIIENNENEQIRIQDVSDCVTIENNTISSDNTGRGIRMLRSSHNVIKDNTITNTHYGIYLDGTLTGDLQILPSSSNTINNNHMTDNDYGVYANAFCFANMFYHNYFANNNVKNAYDAGTNLWYHGLYFEGNYWDDYTGVDEDGDGIGDSPYTVGPYLLRNKDHYPIIDDNNTEFIYGYQIDLQQPNGKQILSQLLNVILPISTTISSDVADAQEKTDTSNVEENSLPGDASGNKEDSSEISENNDLEEKNIIENNNDEEKIVDESNTEKTIEENIETKKPTLKIISLN